MILENDTEPSKSMKVFFCWGIQLTYEEKKNCVCSLPSLEHNIQAIDKIVNRNRSCSTLNLTTLKNCKIYSWPFGKNADAMHQ